MENRKGQKVRIPCFDEPRVISTHNVFDWLHFTAQAQVFENLLPINLFFKKSNGKKNLQYGLIINNFVFLVVNALL